MVDGLIRLFDSTETSFITNGLGVLTDTIKCVVTEERNGMFELEMTYPITGIHYKDISLRNILVAKSNPYSNPQAFRIYDISKPMNGVVTIYADHISYDLSGYPVSPFIATNIKAAFSALKEFSVINHPFTFVTSRETEATMMRFQPGSIRSFLGGSEGSILDVYGGEYEFDNFVVKNYTHRGEDRGYEIRYGKNLMDLEQEENCNNVFTGVYPYWYTDEDGLIELPEKYLHAEGEFDYEKIFVMNVSDHFMETPTLDDIRNYAISYMNVNKIGVPKVSLTVSFINLSDTEEYKHIEMLEQVHLCDTVTIIFDKLNVSSTAKVIETQYNVLTGKYDSISLGEAKSNLTSVIATTGSAVEEIKVESNEVVQKAVAKSTDLIMSGTGAYVVLHSSTGENRPDEILIMDAADISMATNVWRWNNDGLSHSSTGYHGSYTTAITITGDIVADFIKQGTMTGNRIRGGLIQIGGPKKGIFEVVNEAGNKTLVKMDKDGFVLDSSVKIPYENLSNTPEKLGDFTNDIFRSGSGTIESNGECLIVLNPGFTDTNYKVFLSLIDSTEPITLSEKNTSSFKVTGTVGDNFDWLLIK